SDRKRKCRSIKTSNECTLTVTCFNEPHCSKSTQSFADSRTTDPVIFRCLFYRFYTISWCELSILYSLNNFVSNLLIRFFSFYIFYIYSLPQRFHSTSTRLQIF